MTHPMSSSFPAEQRPLQRKQSGRRPPGPSWYTAAQNTFGLVHHRLDFIIKMRERYGDVISLPTLLGPFSMVFHPDDVRHIFQENHRNYNKDVPDWHVLSLVLGKGLLTNDGELWLRQRRLIQPAFHRERVAAFGTLMTETTLTWLERGSHASFLSSMQPYLTASFHRSISIDKVFLCFLPRQPSH